MTQPQGPKDDGGSRTRQENGKKKPATEAKLPATEMAEKPFSEILTQYVEQDEPEGREIEDLAPVMEEDEPEEEEPAEGEEDQGEIIDQEEHGKDCEEKSPESEEKPVTETSAGEEDQKQSDEIDEELIERTVDELIESEHRTSEVHHLVAKNIVDRFLGGDYKAASDKNPWKTNSLKKLRDHERLPITARRLGDRIRQYGCWAAIDAKDPKVAPGPSIALELIAIEDEDERYNLAVEVYEKKLSVRATRKRVLEITSKKVDPRLVDRLLSKIKDPRSLPVSKDYEKMDEEFLENELSKKERLLLRAEMDTKRDQLTVCSAFLDLLEKRLSDIDL